MNTTEPYLQFAYKTRMKTYSRCRVCGGDRLSEIADLGHCPPSDRFLTSNMLGEPEVFYPLVTVRCNNCKLVQLRYVVDPHVLFGDAYVYDSMSSKLIRDHFSELASVLQKESSLNDSSMVVDIGSNTGVLLKPLHDLRIQVCGVDPVPELAARANSMGLFTFESFWNHEVTELFRRRFGRKADVVYTSILGHVEDLHAFLRCVKRVLDKNGIFVFESPYLAEIFGNLAYDTMYHEHLNYWSLAAAQRLLAMHELEVFRVEINPAVAEHSLRVFCAPNGTHSMERSVETIRSNEKGSGINQAGSDRLFRRAVKLHRQWLRKTLARAKFRGKRIAGISAPAKSTLLLNYSHIGTETLEYLTDANPMKQGRFSPGMHIPVYGDERLKTDKVDYGLVLAWNQREAIERNTKWFKEFGGHFMLPKPLASVAPRHDWRAALEDLVEKLGGNSRNSRGLNESRGYR